MTFGPTYQSTSHSVLQFPIAFKLGMKYPKIPINGYSNLDRSISACGNRSSQFLIYWDTEWWNTVLREEMIQITYAVPVGNRVLRMGYLRT